MFAGSMDFSGMSRIKLKTEEMEAQVRSHGHFMSGKIFPRFDFITLPVVCFFFLYMCLFSPALSGEGAAAGEPAGAGAGASGGAEEAALRAGRPRGGAGRRGLCGRQLPTSASAHPAGLVRGLSGLSQRAALPQHAELLADQPLLAAALRRAAVVRAGQQLLAAVRSRLPGLHSAPGLHPIPALHLAPHPEQPEASVLPALGVHGRRLPAALAVPPAENPPERHVGGQVDLQEVQHLHQVGELAEERGKSRKPTATAFAFLVPTSV